MNVAMEHISEKIKRLREIKGITKYRLAKNTGLDEAYLGQLEAGKVDQPRRDTLAALAKGLGVEPGVFFGGDEKRPIPDLIREISERYQAMQLIDLPIKGTIPGHYPFTIEKSNNSVTILKEWVNDVADMSNLYALEIINDDLKDEEIYAGYTLIIDPADINIVEGKLYLVRKDDEAHVHRAGSLPPEGGEIIGRVVLAGRWKKL